MYMQSISKFLTTFSSPTGILYQLILHQLNAEDNVHEGAILNFAYRSIKNISARAACVFQLNNEAQKG